MAIYETKMDNETRNILQMLLKAGKTLVIKLVNIEDGEKYLKDFGPDGENYCTPNILDAREFRRFSELERTIYFLEREGLKVFATVRI